MFRGKRAFNRARLPFLSALVFLFVACLAVQATNAEPVERPLIGLNMDVDEKSPCTYWIYALYVQAIVRVGGIPLLMPPMAGEDLRRVLSLVDGVMMIGGDDYPPSLYGQTADPAVVPMPEERSRFDLIMVDELLREPSLPFLGICAGCQALNIRLGGSLVQDIPSRFPESPIQHASPDGWQKGFSRHPVKIEPDSKLARMLQQTQLEVVSSHHQCVDRLGKGLRAVAKSPDGVVESVELPERAFGIGVQWHPERDFEANEPLLRQFIKQCKAYRQARRTED